MHDAADDAARAPALLYLWFEHLDGADFVHLFSPGRHARVPAPALPCAASELPDAFLPAIDDALLGADPGHAQALLVLDAGLPIAWQHAPWERSLIRGAPLATQFLVVRHARPPFDAAPAGQATSTSTAPAAAPDARATAWLNLFPADEFHFDFSHAARLPNRIAPRWIARQLPHHRELFVLAHGDARGLLDADGQPFSLGDHAGTLPPCVWLLACNADDGMFEQARQLLQHGVETVVTAWCQLDAPHMQALLTRWMDAPAAHHPAAWLCRQRARDTADGGVRTLTVFGKIVAQQGEQAAFNARTLHAYRQHNRRKLPRLEDSGTAFEHATRAFEPARGLWPLTREWLYPALLNQAENRDHRLMARLLHLARDWEPSSARSVAMANSWNREGHYAHVCAELHPVIDGGHADPHDRAQALGLLANLGIDLNLPALSDWAIAEHERCHVDDADAARQQAHKRLDWSARLALRRLDFGAALRIMQRKREQARTMAEGLTAIGDDRRELAWLLYIDAWRLRLGDTRDAGPADAASWREQAWSALRPDAPQTGNAPDPYLLRALGAHAWASGDASELDRLRAELARHPSPSPHDPGPSCFTAAFIALASAEPAALPEVIQRLREAHYFLEGAAFAGLAGLTDQHALLLAQFNALRDRVCTELARYASPGFPADPASGAASTAIPM